MNFRIAEMLENDRTYRGLEQQALEQINSLVHEYMCDQAESVKQTVIAITNSVYDLDIISSQQRNEILGKLGVKEFIRIPTFADEDERDILAEKAIKSSRDYYSDCKIDYPKCLSKLERIRYGREIKEILPKRFWMDYIPPLSIDIVEFIEEFK